MRNEPSQHPRDVVARAAMQDAVTLANLVAGEFQASHPGPDWQGYLTILENWLRDFGGVVEGDSRGAVATFEGREIAIRFGPVSGHR
jgi:hypothetical protein